MVCVVCVRVYICDCMDVSVLCVCVRECVCVRVRASVCSHTCTPVCTVNADADGGQKRALDLTELEFQ